MYRFLNIWFSLKYFKLKFSTLPAYFIVCILKLYDFSKLNSQWY